MLCEIVSCDHPNEILISTFFRILIFKAFWRNDNFWVKCLLFFSFLVHENRLTKGLGYLYLYHLRFLPKRGTKLHRYVTKTFVHLQVLQVSAINVKLSLLSLFPNQTLIRSMLRDEQLMSRNAVPRK